MFELLVEAPDRAAEPLATELLVTLRCTEGALSRRRPGTGTGRGAG
jgi:hypothetical protein